MAMFDEDYEFRKKIPRMLGPGSREEVAHRHGFVIWSDGQYLEEFEVPPRELPKAKRFSVSYKPGDDPQEESERAALLARVRASLAGGLRAPTVVQELCLSTEENDGSPQKRVKKGRREAR